VSPQRSNIRIQKPLNADSYALNLRRIFPRTGRFDGEEIRNRSTCQARKSSGDVELTFLGDPFESLGRAFDPVLTVVAVGREQADHLIGAAGGRTGNIAGSKIDGFSNGELVLQRPSPRKTPAALTVPANFGQLKTPRQSSTAASFLASNIRAWQVREFCRFFSAING
jgi:hypothetical protein